jgi:hypothetical protein
VLALAFGVGLGVMGVLGASIQPVQSLPPDFRKKAKAKDTGCELGGGFAVTSGEKLQSSRVSHSYFFIPNTTLVTCQLVESSYLAWCR